MNEHLDNGSVEVFGPQFRAGDVLWYWKKGFPTIQHYALVVRPNVVLENLPGVGERLVPLDEFLARCQIFRGQRAGWNRELESRLQAILRNPKNYDLVTRNCQATVNEVILGRAISPQVNSAVGMAALIGFVLLLVSASNAA